MLKRTKVRAPRVEQLTADNEHLTTRDSQSILFQPPIKGASAQAKRFGGLLRVAVTTRECPLDQIPLDLVQAHDLEARRRIALGAQTEVRSLCRVALRHQH